MMGSFFGSGRKLGGGDVDRSSRPHHLDYLDAVTWLTSMTPRLSRPSQITMLGWRLVTRPSVAANKLFAIPSCLVGSTFSFLHGQHMHSEFGVGPPSCLDLARGSSYPPSIKRILTITHRHPLKCCCFGSPFRLSPIPIFSLVIALNKILQL